SLELVDPDSNTRLADNWRDSDESAKSAWTTIEFSGKVGSALGHPAGSNLHVYLLGEGECLLDDVEVVRKDNLNLVSNPGFESGLSGWVPQGALDQSTIEPGGFTGTQSLHIRAGSRGDPGANKIRSADFLALSENDPVTLRCKARWLKGWPELLLRLQGGGVEAFGRLSVPSNLGTPGKANSRRAPLAGPALYDVRHSPVLPATNQPVVVTARVDDSKGLKNISLRYRIDPSRSFAEVSMNDLGEQGDEVAHDGIFSATIPSQPAGKLVAFHIAATNRLDAGNTFPPKVFPDISSERFFPGDSLSHECLIRFGEPLIGGRVPTYRLWLTEANRDRWVRRDRLNNADLDVTFVYNDERVVYGAGAQTAGSPWHTDQMATGPDGTNRFDYVVHLPKDSPILGETDFNLVIPGNGDGAGSSDLSGLSEPVSLLLFRDMGLPYLHRRFIHFFVNGTERSSVEGLPGHFVYEDVQQPNRKSLHEWFTGDSHGQLFKIEDWFEFTNSVATGFENKDADLLRRTFPGTTNLNAAPYRFMFRLRGLQAGESGNDYKDFFQLIDAISPNADPNAPIDFDKVNEWADLDEWFRVFACQRTLGNWDSYGWERGKNCYLYRPGKGKFVLIPWDVDATLALGGREPTSDLFVSNDPRIDAMLKLPAIKRKYLRSFQEILKGPLRPGNLESAFDVRAEALLSNGVSYDPSLTLANKAYLAARRAYIAEQLSTYEVSFSVAAPSKNVREQTRLKLHGKAPLQVDGIRINSEPAEVTWITPIDWTLTVSLHAGTNVFEVEGTDRQGSTSMRRTDRVSLVVEEK
ncbi:MAG: spore coat protein, partial [Verrucomicrobiales bacterium]|nr:spore coat protein [Verrucomicrobiales bacterium]